LLEKTADHHHVPAPPPTRRRRGTGAIVGVGALALALIATGLALVASRGAPPAQARPLALAFAPGDTATYGIHTTLDATASGALVGGSRPVSVDVRQVVTWTVRGVDADGVATVRVSVDEVSGTVDGSEIPTDASAIPPITLEIAPDGRVLSAGGLALGGAADTSGLGFPGLGQIAPLLPDDGRAVVPGDTWRRSFSQDVPFGEGSIRYIADSRYDRDENVDGRSAAVIVSDMRVPVDLTLRLADLGHALGHARDPLGGPFEDASLAYSGAGTMRQTSSVDLAAQELLGSHGTGSFALTVSLAGVQGLEGSVRLDGTFTQDVAAR
jgi:hypothetical protein